MSVRKRIWTTSKGVEKEAWIADYTDGQGKRRIKTFRRKKDADVWADKTRVAVRAGEHIPDAASITVKQAAEIWHKAVAKGRDGRDPAEPSTLRQYRSHIKHHILPELGNTKLSQLSGPHVAAFRDYLLEKLSRPMAKKVLTSFKGIMREAQSRGLLTINWASTISIQTKKGTRHDEEISIPNKAEIKSLLAKLDQLAEQDNEKRAKAWRRWRVLMATAIHTGLRASEFRGLPWENIDLKDGKITVAQRADENGKIGPPKSASSRRIIKIPMALVTLLRDWKAECPPGALALPNRRGSVESLANIHNRCWKPLQLAAGLAAPKKDELGNVIRVEGKPVVAPKYTLHSLRHFHASLLIEDEANPKEIQVEMGHSSIAITYDLYGHLFRDDEADKRRSERAERLAASLY